MSDQAPPRRRFFLGRSASAAEPPALRREGVGVGIALVLTTCFIFGLSDAVAKIAVATLPAAVVFWIRCVVVATLTAPVVLWRRGPAVLRTTRPWHQLARVCLTVGSSLMFLNGLRYLALADATAINFIWPILVTVFSVLFLREVVGVRRVLATLAGFAGMLIIIRPGSGAFQLAAVFPLGAALLWAASSVLTRDLSRHDAPETTIAWSAVGTLAAATVALPFFWRVPTAEEALYSAMIGVGSAIGHAMIVIAYSRASASSLAPYAYAQLVWAGVFGFAFFGALPDRWIVLGSVIIVASGIYTIHRERVRRLER